MSQTIVIVGTGQGGFQAAASLRQDGFAGRIVMFGDETALPYQRPPLSKAYMKDGEAAKLLLRPEAFYDTNTIEIRRGTRVDRIDRDARQVVTADGETLGYDHLILATGARNAVPPIRNITAPGVFDLRTLDHATALREAVARAPAALVIGGGFIGLEFAAVARAAGLDVTVFEMAPRLMARVVSPEMSERFAALHTGMGTRLVMGQPVTEILTDADGRARGVRLGDGQEFESALILLASGVVPNTELAAGAGLEVVNGVVVDAQLLTSDPAISALGDCAAFPDPATGRHIRLESVQAATDHARAIAKRLTGSPAPYAAVPWFWSDQADWKLQIAGIGDGADAAHVIDGDNGGVCVLRFRGDTLVAVETVNMAKDHMAARRLFSPDRPVSRAEVEACGHQLAELLKSRKAMAA